MSLAEAFGRVLKQKREALKLSQEELGFEAGLPFFGFKASPISGRLSIL
ncbi:MAG: hypothetical protein F6K54_11930 [Okeania sp. SIO3B5]|nr:hypothetical protein [Okeania sp. SIO3B5]